MAGWTATSSFDGRPGDPTLPQRALAAVMQWVLSRTDCVLCIRPRAGEDLPVFPADPRIVLTGQDWPLASLLHATDLVVTLYGIADAAVPVPEISQALERWIGAPRLAVQGQVPATRQVLAVMGRFL